MRRMMLAAGLACLLLTGCGQTDMVAFTTVTRQESAVEDTSPQEYPIVEAVISPDGKYTAEAAAYRTRTEVTVRELESGLVWQFVLPDGSAIPEYTFLPEDWCGWLEANTLLVTVGRGGDAGEQHTYRCSLEVTGGELSAAVMEQTGETLDADYDFTHDGRADTLERMTVLDPDTGEALWHELWVRNSVGDYIWSCALSAGGPSWDTSLFALKREEGDCLMLLVTGMGQGNCSYFYEIFSLDETGQMNRLELGETAFDVNYGSPAHVTTDCIAVADFLWRVKELTAGADSLLMDVDVTDGLRCHVSPSVFEHTYHHSELIALESREAIAAALAAKE